ncbi:hypothetical protein EV216_13317 [Rhodovulum steppense]|uniref:Uncharacterized protein n=1 Tax=Rhodovulum steppense TaxID=540251 RepID=A0A4R1YIW6_9RHOB|nr:hypothetical protein EV216_13317 [Rhodovulum steppense]
MVRAADNHHDAGSRNAARPGVGAGARWMSCQFDRRLLACRIPILLLPHHRNRSEGRRPAAFHRGGPHLRCGCGYRNDTQPHSAVTTGLALADPGRITRFRARWLIPSLHQGRDAFRAQSLARPPIPQERQVRCCVRYKAPACRTSRRKEQVSAVRWRSGFPERQLAFSQGRWSARPPCVRCASVGDAVPTLVRISRRASCVCDARYPGPSMSAQAAG